MKLYNFRAKFLDGDSVFRDMVPDGYSDWYSESRLEMESGLPLRMDWCVGSEKKAESDVIPFLVTGLASSSSVIRSLIGYSKKGSVFDVSIHGSVSQYLFLKAANFQESDVEIDHIFMMFPKRKGLLVTETVKNYWESRCLTGAVFTQVAEMDDDKFIEVKE